MGMEKQTYEKPWFEKLKPDEISRGLSELRQLDKEDACRLIVENAYEGIIVAQNNKVCFINKRVSDLTGYTRDELLSMNGIDLIHPDDKVWVADRLNRRLQGENPENTYPVRFITKEGEVKWIQTTSIKISWEGQPAVLWFVTDISAQKQTETALKESEMRYRNMVDHAVVGVYETDIKGGILYINDAMAKIFEWESTQEPIGKTVDIVYKNIEDREVFLKILNQHGLVKNFELEFVTKTGKTRHAMVTAALYGDKISGTLMDITERKKSQEALHTLINATHDIALLIEPDGTVVTINSQAAETFKKTPGELIGQCIYQFMSQDLAEHRRNYINEALLSKRPAQHIDQYRDQYYVTNLFPISDSEDNVSHLALFVKDITELKKAEEDLRASEKQYRNIVDNALIGVYESSLNGEIIYANFAMAGIFEFDSAAEMIGTGVVSRYKNSDDRKVLIKNLKDKGQIEDFEVNVLTKTGKTKNVVLSAVLDGDKISGMIMDVSARMQAEEALHESRETLDTLINASHDVALLVDINGIVLAINKIAAASYGVESHGLIGKNIYEFMTPELAAARDKKAREVLSIKKPVNYIQYNESRIFDVNVNPVLDNEGNVQCMAIFAKDITDLKEAEAELKKTHDKLEGRVAERTKELKHQTQHLEEANTALKVLLERRNEDKNEMEEKIITNVKELVVPYLEKVKRKVADKKLQAYLDILEANLNNIVSPFSNKLSSKYLNLTSSEIEVADLVKHGKSTKEIADLLNVSIKTVETHRVNMRKKLGITNKKANLRTFLLSLG